MRLLVTRAEPEASELATRLRGLGHDVLAQPLTLIRLAAEPEDVPPKPAAIAVTSRNAIRALLAWPRASAWRDATVYAVGAATAAAARGAGFGDVRVGSGDALALAALVRGDFDPRRGILLYAAGCERAHELSALLPGVDVTTVEAYAADAAEALDPAIQQALRQEIVDGVLLFSRRAAAIFCDLARPAIPAPTLLRPAYFVLSRQIAQPLAALGPARLVVAAQPNLEALLAALAPPLVQSR